MTASTEATPIKRYLMLAALLLRCRAALYPTRRRFCCAPRLAADAGVETSRERRLFPATGPVVIIPRRAPLKRGVGCLRLPPPAPPPQAGRVEVGMTPPPDQVRCR